MNQVWSFFFEFFSSAGFPKLWSETAAGGVCAVAVAAVAVFVCYAMDKFVRRLIIRKADGSRHREKAIRFARALHRVKHSTASCPMHLPLQEKQTSACLASVPIGFS